MEEIAKSQLAADVCTGLQTEEDFKAICYKHEKKIKRMAWATKDAADYLSADGMFVEMEKLTFKVPNDAMYIELKDGKVYTPSVLIGREEA